MGNNMEVSKETKQEVMKIAEQFGKTKEDAKDDFKELYKLFTSGKINTKNQDVETVVLKALKGKYSAEYDGQPKVEYEAYVLDIAEPKDIITKEGKEMKVSNAYVIAFNPKEPNGKYSFAKVGHFENNVNKVLDLEKGQFYKVKVTSRGMKGNVLNLTAVDLTTWKKIDKDVEGFDDPSEVLKSAFQKVDIAEGEMKIKEDGLFLTEARVVSARLVDKKDGSGRLGIYKVVDDSIDDDAEELEKMGGGMTVFVDEHLMTCGMYSTALFMGRFSINNDYGGIQMNAELVVPIIHVPFEPSEHVSGKQTKLTEENENDSFLDDEDL